MPAAVTAKLAILPATASKIERVTLASDYVMFATAHGADATFLEQALAIPCGSFVGAIIDGKLAARYSAALGDQARLYSRTSASINTALAIRGRATQAEKSGRDVASEYSGRAIGIREDIAELGNSIPALGTALLVQDRQAARALKQARREKAEVKQSRFKGPQGLIDRITAGHRVPDAQGTQECDLALTDVGAPVTSGHADKLKSWMNAGPAVGMFEANTALFENEPESLPVLRIAGLPIRTAADALAHSAHNETDNLLAGFEIDMDDEIPGPVQPSAAGAVPAAKEPPPKTANIVMNIGKSTQRTGQAPSPKPAKLALSVLQTSRNQHQVDLAAAIQSGDQEEAQRLRDELASVMHALTIAERERASTPAQSGMASPGWERPEYQDQVEQRRRDRDARQQQGGLAQPFRFA